MEKGLKERPRLLILTEWFDPEPIPKGLSFAKGLSARGFDVDVLTGFPNYPDGRVYSGYSLQPYLREEHDGVTVHRTWLYPSHDRSAARRSLTYLSFAVSSALTGMVAIRRPDVIYAYHPPATTGMTAALLKRRFRAPLVLDVQDLWPDTVMSSGMMRGGLAMKTLQAACRREYAAADRVTTLSEQMAHLLAVRGVPKSRLRVIRNWADESRIDAPVDEVAVAAGRARLGSGFTILFAGQMGEAQRLENAVNAAALTPEIHWVFLGGGTDVERLRGLAAARELANVSFLPRVGMEEVRAWLHAADVLLVHLGDDPLYEASIPSKTQAYMLAGRPILMCARGAAAQLVESAEAGVTCSPERPEELARAARALASMTAAERCRLGANGRAYYERELAFDVGVQHFAELFREVLDERGT